MDGNGKQVGIRSWNFLYETIENVQAGEEQSDIFFGTAVWKIDAIDTRV